ncbi:unnamed protein product [Protopolystoma xenopodis]|uniref:Uncharacterized protein n=1 Tax=Protopolystoma xenopodis TaxID=117903 RepID=A0A448XMM6_9PLAT|nr:unnamed protein product [Protopolystoma xenopodis]
MSALYRLAKIQHDLRTNRQASDNRALVSEAQVAAARTLTRSILAPDSASSRFPSKHHRLRLGRRLPSSILLNTAHLLRHHSSRHLRHLKHNRVEAPPRCLEAGLISSLAAFSSSSSIASSMSSQQAGKTIGSTKVTLSCALPHQFTRTRRCRDLRRSQRRRRSQKLLSDELILAPSAALVLESPLEKRKQAYEYAPGRQESLKLPCK